MNPIETSKEETSKEETPKGAHAYAAAHQRKKKWRATVACLGVLVAACTVYALMTSASTLEGKTYCGLEEHVHAESCYESVLSCGLEEAADEVTDEATDETTDEAADEAVSVASEVSGHTHTEACYEQVLVCELEEHAHIDECYINPDAENLEAAALPDGAQIPDGYTELYTARNDDEGFAVSVYAPEGALPEEATLSAALINEDNEAYTQVEEELSESLGVDFSSEEESDETDFGFVAFDIHFSDAEGNEIEPTSEVYVVIDAEDLLPEGVDSDTLAVQHHAESDDAVNVETVADAGESTEGVVAATDEAGVQAAFAVDGFSTFTISWTSGSTTYFRVTVYYVDSSGNLINGVETTDVSVGNISNNGSEEHTFSTYVKDISGYTYLGARYGSYNGDTVTSMTFSSSRSGSTTTRTLTFYNENSTVETVTYSNQTRTADVYLVYSYSGDSGSSSGDGESTGVDGAVSLDKMVNLRDDGNYDLTLSISGSVDEEETINKVDVLFIVDVSGSMADNYQNNGLYRLTNTKNAMTAMVNTLTEAAYVDVQYSIVTFTGASPGAGSSSDARTVLDWTSTTRDVESAINSLSASGNTNYQAGLEKGAEQLDDARKDAITVVIFLSDGAPTRANGYTSGTSTEAWNATMAQAREIECDRFYAVGIGSSQAQYLRALIGTDGVNADIKEYIEADSGGSNLTSLFAGIAGELTKIAAENVTAYDQLSENVDIVVAADGYAEFTIVVENSEGREWDVTGTTESGEISLTFENADGGDVVLTVYYDSDNKAITIDFPDDYKLEAGYTYSVTTVIAASDEAKRKGTGTDAPDPGTGTYADDELGLWSNVEGSAYATYNFNDMPGSTEFPKPIIQVEGVDITFTKVDSDGTTSLTGAEFLLYYTDENDTYYYLETTLADGEPTASWTSEKSEDNTLKDDGSGVFTVYNLSPGTYYLVETVAPDGYNLLTYPIIITINDTTANVYYYDDEDEPMYLGVGDDGSYLVRNTTGQELPSAGGSGTTLITCTGIALVAIAGCGYGLKRIRKRRGNLG